MEKKNGWIRRDYWRRKSEIYICPHCGKEVYFRYQKGAEGCLYPLCPWCGKGVELHEVLLLPL